ncbi:MAG: hypothetical protein DYG89_24685 [Caldilinea sp. CFX5]|nr:hypothetical protein [Caldilinea sp. CFX5]
MPSRVPADTLPAHGAEPGHTGHRFWLLLLAAVGLLLVVGAVIYRRLHRLLTPVTVEEKGMVKEPKVRQSQAAAPDKGAEQTVSQAPARAPATATAAEGETLGYEAKDVSVRGVVVATTALFVMIGVVLLVVGGLLGLLGSLHLPLPPVTLVQPQATPAPPDLWIAPGANAQAYRRQENALLAEAKWLDDQKRAAHIPITQAMQLVVDQGLPARNQAPPTFGLPPAYQLGSAGGAPLPTSTPTAAR